MVTPLLSIDLGTRKLIKNNSSCIMTLPIMFTKLAGLSAGDTVRVSMSTDGALMVTPDERDD